MAFSSALCHGLPAANETINRFDARFFHLDFPITAIATVVADVPNELNVMFETRSNRDLIGLLWTSLDRWGHPLLQYVTDMDYTGVKLAFVGNPPRPYNFSVTMQINGAGYVHRMYPFKIDAVSGRVVPDVQNAINNGGGPGTSYTVAELFPNGVTVPAGKQIYVIDFDKMKLGFNFDGDKIPPNYITHLFFSLVSPNAGLGEHAILKNVGQYKSFSRGDDVYVKATEHVTEWTILNVAPDLILTKGDEILISLTAPSKLMEQSKSGVGSYELETTSYAIRVNEVTGYGTTQRSIKMADAGGDFVWVGGPCSATKLQKDTATGSEAFTFNMSNIAVTGARATIPRRYYPQPAHRLMMTSGYDDEYNVTPWRHITQIYELGYRGFINMYMGMSHYFKARSWNEDQKYHSEVIKDAAEPLNGPTVQWCNNIFKSSKVMGYEFIWSTAFEILNTYMPPDWAQRDYLNRIGLSGWVPPSSFVSVTNPDCIDYLARVIRNGLRLAAAAGLPCRFQIGEPWYWDGSYSNGAPCIYTPDTMALYTAETGKPVPTPLIANYLEPVTETQRPYLEWLRSKLGHCTDQIRDKVKAEFPSSKGTLLFFTPQIMNPIAEILTIINFPFANWVYPNYDFIQIEDYDWIIAGDLGRVPDTIHAATVTLNYPLNQVHYFVGFVGDANQPWVWPNMNIAIRDAKAAGIPNLYVWAYPQVIRDGIMYDDTIVGTQPAIQPYVPPRRQLPDSIKDAIIRPVYFCQIGDDMRMNSSDKHVEFGGNTWYATGTLGQITGLNEGLTSSESGWAMSLTALPTTDVETIANSVRLKEVRLYIGLIDDAHINKFEPKMIARGAVMETTISVDRGFATISIQVRSSMSNWAKASSARYSDEYQQVLFPDDRGFRFLTALQTQKLNWGE